MTDSGGDVPAGTWHDDDIERSVLGAILLNNAVYDDVAQILKEDDFFKRPNKLIYRSIERVIATSGVVELLNLCADLKDSGDIDDAGGYVYIASLEQNVLSTGHAVSSAYRVKRDSDRRKLYAASIDVQDMLTDPSCTEDAAKRLRAELSMLSMRYQDDVSPLPLVSDKEPLPKFPTKIFPPEIARFVDQISTQVQTPNCFAASVVLGIMSASLAGKVNVMGRYQWIEPVCLYMLPVMNSGERKGPVFKSAMTPIRRYTKRLRKAYKESKDSKRGDMQEIENLIARAKAEAKKPGGDINAAKQVANLEERLAAMKPRKPKIYVVTDTTSEALADVLIANDGFAAIIDSEESIFGTIVNSRYTKGDPNIDIILKGFSGESLSIMRRSRGEEPAVVMDPALTITITPQESVLRRVEKAQVLNDRGFAGRFLYSIGEPIKDKDTWPPAISESVFEDYCRVMMRMLSIPNPTRDDGGRGNYIVKLSQEAEDIFRAYLELVNKRLGVEGDLSPIQTWANKMNSFVLRIAAILHIVDLYTGSMALPEGDWINLPIKGHRMRDAISLVVEYYLPHARRAYAIMGIDQPADGLRDASDLAKYICKMEGDYVPYKKLAAWALSSKKWDAQRLMDALYKLQQYGWIEPEWQEERIDKHGKKRGRPSKRPHGYVLAPGARYIMENHCA